MSNEVFPNPVKFSGLISQLNEKRGVELRSEIINIQGNDVHCLRLGDVKTAKKMVYVIPAFFIPAIGMYPLMEELHTALGEDACITIIDTPGVGLSPRRNNNIGTGIDGNATVIEEIIAQDNPKSIQAASSSEKVIHLFGYSKGCLEAVKAASRLSDKGTEVNSITLFAPSINQSEHMKETNKIKWPFIQALLWYFNQHPNICDIFDRKGLVREKAGNMIRNHYYDGMYGNMFKAVENGFADLFKSLVDEAAWGASAFSLLEVAKTILDIKQEEVIKLIQSLKANGTNVNLLVAKGDVDVDYRALDAIKYMFTTANLEILGGHELPLINPPQMAQILTGLMN